MTENDLSRIVVDTCYHIHVQLGPGLLESAYEEILSYELQKRGLQVERQKAIPIIWGPIEMEKGYRADLVVEGKLLLEIKSTEGTSPLHLKQTLTYIRLLDLRLALLINFNVPYIKDGIQRIVNNL